jgi:hypothetical protein
MGQILSWPVWAERLITKALAGTEGLVSFPLLGQLGLQIGAAGGGLQHRGFESVGGHLFWRNPWAGLLGAYVSNTNWDRFGGVHVTQAAGEFEGYWNRVTLHGIVGAEWGKSASTYYTATTVAPSRGRSDQLGR